MDYMFRDLTADEIEVRVAMAKQKGVSLLLYKDARVDQNILDETVGPFNWMRSHTRDNANCIVSIWDEKKQMWVSKEDVGVESNTEKEKGLASDSFKRACFNWGIGRELYSAPFIWVNAEDCEKLSGEGNRWKCDDHFEVESITIKDKRITAIAIRNSKTKKIVYSLNGNKPKAPEKQPEQKPEKQPAKELPKRTPRERLIARLHELGININAYAEANNLNGKTDPETFERLLKELEKQYAETQKKNQQEQTDFAIEEINQQKEQAKKDYIKEQSGAFVDWRKQSNQYGAEAEQMASSGLANTGFSESSQVSMYNTYQNRIATARESYNLAVQNYNNAITEARLQNNAVLAEIAYNAFKEQSELALQGFQYKNTLIIEKANKKQEINNEYYGRYQDVLQQINTENAMAEEIRQYNEQMAEEKRQFNEQMAEEKRQFNKQMSFEEEQFAWQKKQASKSSSSSKKSSSSSSKKSSSSKSSSSSSSTKINKSKSSSEPQINTKSVIAAGLGPASGTTIANAVKSGKVTATEKNGQIYISANKKKSSSSLPTANELFSKYRF